MADINKLFEKYKRNGLPSTTQKEQDIIKVLSAYEVVVNITPADEVFERTLQFELLLEDIEETDYNKKPSTDDDESE